MTEVDRGTVLSSKVTEGRFYRLPSPVMKIQAIEPLYCPCEVQYTYDNVGNVTEEKVKNGANTYRTTSYSYDYNSNLIKVKQSGSVQNYKYNALGKVTEMEITDKDAANSTFSRITSYEYDNRGNCVKVTDPMGYSEAYYYDPNNDMTKKTDKNGNVINYTYDGMHRVLTVKSTKDGKTQTITNSYSATGGLTSESDGTSAKKDEDKGTVLLSPCLSEYDGCS